MKPEGQKRNEKTEKKSLGGIFDIKNGWEETAKTIELAEKNQMKGFKIPKIKNPPNLEVNELEVEPSVSSSLKPRKPSPIRFSCKENIEDVSSFKLLQPVTKIKTTEATPTKFRTYDTESESEDEDVTLSVNKKSMFSESEDEQEQESEIPKATDDETSENLETAAAEAETEESLPVIKTVPEEVKSKVSTETDSEVDDPEEKSQSQELSPMKEVAADDDDEDRLSIDVDLDL